jgi:hypothetical protein
MKAPHARKISSLPPGGCMSSWDGPAKTLIPPHARKISSLPPTGGRMSSWGGPAQT